MTNLDQKIRDFICELADLSNKSIEEGDPALMGNFRDEARALRRWITRRENRQKSEVK